MDKFWKLMSILLYIFAVLAAFRIIDNEQKIADLSDRLSKLENKKSTVSILVDQQYNQDTGHYEYKVVDMFEELEKAH